MEITSKIKCKIFSQYLGESILIFEPNIDPVSHWLEGIDFDLKQVIAERVNYNPDWIKLILRPLTDITNEEAIEMAELCGGIKGEILLNRPENLKDKDIHFSVQVYTNKPKFSSYSTPKYWTDSYGATAYQYLQSKGFDLPHYLLGGKTLEQSGLAIYKNKTYTDTTVK